MKNNDFEEDRTRRGEKKDNKDDKKRQYELSKSFDTVRTEETRRVGRGVWLAEPPREPPYSRG